MQARGIDSVIYKNTTHRILGLPVLLHHKILQTSFLNCSVLLCVYVTIVPFG